MISGSDSGQRLNLTKGPTHHLKQTKHIRGQFIYTLISTYVKPSLEVKSVRQKDLEIGLWLHGDATGSLITLKGLRQLVFYVYS